MPYLNPVSKEYYYDFVESFKRRSILTPGELNYLLTELVKQYIRTGGKANYETYNSVIGTLECCKLEFCRRMLAPYEDKKKEENGDVY